MRNTIFNITKTFALFALVLMTLLSFGSCTSEPKNNIDSNSSEKLDADKKAVQNPNVNNDKKKNVKKEPAPITGNFVWTQEDIDKVLIECQKSLVGKVGIDEDKYCNCMLDIVKGKYDPNNLANADVGTIQARVKCLEDSYKNPSKPSK